MQIDSFFYFQELIAAGSFYKAAQNSYLTQQGFNKAITSIESELNTKLIERSRSGVRLTEKGEIFLKQARKITDEYSKLLTEILKNPNTDNENLAQLKVNATYYPIQVLGGFYNKAQLLGVVSLNEYSFKDIVVMAQKSDGTELFIADPITESIKKLHPDIVFEPILKTRYGMVCKESCTLAGEEVLHREAVEHMPVAVNAFREMVQVTDSVFGKGYLKNIKMQATNPRMLLDYASTSSEVASTFDSFGFYLSCRDPEMPTDGLRFIPLATPKASCQVGFLYNKIALPNLYCRNAITRFKELLKKQFKDYFQQHPL